MAREIIMIGDKVMDNSQNIYFPFDINIMYTNYYTASSIISHVLDKYPFFKKHGLHFYSGKTVRISIFFF
jgi:hypothetical protein